MLIWGVIMGKEYYNCYSFTKAVNMLNEDIYLAIELFKQYTEDFPDDYMAMIYYASALITVKKMEEAKQVLNNLKIQLSNDKKFTKYEDKCHKNDAALTFINAKLFFYNDQYQECYDLINKKNDLLRENGFYVNAALLFSQKKISNDTIQLPSDDFAYLYKQIDNYSFETFYDHIQKHLYGYTGCEETKGVFDKNFKLEEVIKYFNKNIPSDKSLFSGLIEDAYYFKYDSCGKVDNKYTDYFKLIAIHGTNHYITMTPVENGKNMPHVDLNYLQEELMTNTSDRIARFNKKYAKYLIKQ